MGRNITHSELTSRLRYDPETGVFLWLKGRNAGKVAGSFDGRYHAINIRRGMLYHTHRLAWFYIHKKWPKGPIDHINRDKTDNRLCNLRESTKALNSINRATPQNNTTGYTGVSRCKKTGKFHAYIGVDGKRKTLGWFQTVAEAYEHRRQAELRFYGEFAP